jgi:protein involved in polysaccharide export with SLBB domain
MTQLTSTFSRVALVLLFALFLCAPLTTQAQISSEAASELLESAQTNPLLLLRQRLTQSALASSGIPMEGAVDPAEYVVGPGDAFMFVINGQDVTAAPITVGADGRIALPDAGLVEVGGLLLQDARQTISDALAKYYEDAETDISLVQPRQFYVHVTGSVPVPGRFLALPVSRVSNVLELAFADTSSLASTNPDFQPSLRNVEVRSKDGSIRHFDMVRYLAAGDIASNPYLQDGDIVHVPSFNPEYRSISVGGRVPFPGLYEFRQGDTLSDLLAMAGGIDGDEGVKEIIVTRLSGTAPELNSFSLAEARGEVGDAFSLEALDVVSVIEREEERGIVRLEGRVNRPGSYPIIDGVTTLQEVLAAAGGLRSDALSRGSYLERRSLPNPASEKTPDRNTSVPQAVREIARVDTMAVFQRVRLTDLDFMSRNYFARELGFQNRVSINMDDVVSGTANPIPLRSGDRLFVPRDEQTVYVFGQVLQPGYIAVESGQSADYYLTMAGGLSSVAGQVLVINPATGAVNEDLSTEMKSGDVLFVDMDFDVADDPELERLNIERDRSRADARIRSMQTIFQGVGTLASLITLIITIRRN